MTKNDLNDELRKQFRFLVRFLKERGIYSKYKYYISNPKYRNMQSIPKYSDMDYFEILTVIGNARSAISWPIHWAKTKEGNEFWCSIYDSFTVNFDIRFNGKKQTQNRS